MKPLITVIVPAFNTGNLLYNCIKSIENQTYDNLDIIIINDGSTDNTAEVIDRCISEFNNIRTTNTGNKDICVTRNAGLSAIQGEYFAFVDSDDAIRPDMFEVLYSVLSETGADVAGCSFTRFSPKEMSEWNTELAKSYPKGETTVYDPVEYLNNEVFNKNNSRCWSKLYKTSVIGDLRFDEETVIGEDLLFLVKLLSRIEKIAEINYPGYVYYLNANGAMLRPFKPRYMHNIACWEKVRKQASLLDPTTTTLPTEKLLIAIILTACKLAELNKSARSSYKEYIDFTHSKLISELSSDIGKEGFKLLDKGYKIKGRLFKACPKVFMFLYHLVKSLA